MPVPKAETPNTWDVAGDRNPPPETPVIVLNWNGWEHTFSCLRSLRAALDVRTVWLVDNGSHDDRCGEARTVFAGLRVIQLDQNYGFAGGMNHALRIAVTEGYAYAYLLNNDCVVAPGFLRKALEVARTQNAAVVGSRIAYADTNSLIFDGEYHERGKKPIDADFETKRVSHANGAGMLVNLETLQVHDFFDERFFCYHEEVDLCWRLAASGFQPVVAAGSLIRHHCAGSDVDGNSAYYRTRNQFLLAEHFRGWRRFKRELRCVYEASVAGRRAIRGHDIVSWQALAAAIDDGLHKRFGRRSSYEISNRARLQFRALCAVLPLVGWVLRWRFVQEVRIRARTPEDAAEDGSSRLTYASDLTVAEPPIKDAAK
jgi:GT2 family glycosyltransferase